MANRLANATSPYLLQHAENPVDWWEWGPEAFAEAERRDAPILISVGYAACHWCHVMAHESFEDPAVAAYLNDRFVAVKVDREERPDVDAVYMSATQALTGRGGWPMTVFATPAGEPFYAGTYYPPEPRHGMPSFRQLLQAIDEAWHRDREEVTTAAQRIGAALAEQSRQAASGRDPLQRDTVVPLLDKAVEQLAAEYDEAVGGFATAPKFPPSMVLEFLLRHHARTGDPRSLRMVEGTCEGMARGGMYDQLAGGFARYSVDAQWTVPHFEKMLYDNALLLRAYVHLWRTTGSELAGRVARETAQFLLADLRTPEGGFASALDADTDGSEGATYVWRPGQLTDVLGVADGEWAAALTGVTATGTFEHGTSVLTLRTDPTDPGRWARVRSALHAARAARPQPARDDKVVAAWNGLAISALAEAGALLDEPDWVRAADRCADLLLDLHLDDGRLRRVSRDGVAGTAGGVLEDYADLAAGLLTLHQVTGDRGRLAAAGLLLDAALEHFRDPQSGDFFDTPHDGEQLVIRPQDPADTAAPSGRSALADALLSYAALTGSEHHRTAAEDALATVAGRLPARFAGWSLATLEAWLDGPREVAVVGPDTQARAALHRVALAAPAPGLVVSVGEPDSGAPLLAGRVLLGGEATAYVCRHFSCDAPVTAPAALAEQLAGAPDGARADTVR